MGILGKQTGAKAPSSSTTVIAKGCNISGEFQLSCDIQIDGIIEGRLHCERSLVVSKDGRVSGDIRAERIIVNGELEGNCFAKRIDILAEGQVSGTIHTNDLSIERGGKLFGQTLPEEQEQQVIEFNQADEANA